MNDLLQPRPFDQWHEDMGSVLWFFAPITEPPYVGTPLDLGRTMLVEITIGFEHVELPAQQVGGWPWQQEDEPQLWWTPLPDCNEIQRRIDGAQHDGVPA